MPASGPFFSGITAAFTSLNLAEEYFFLNGNSAAVKWNGHAVARTGKTIDFEGIDVLDCNDEGKIVMVRAFWDAGAVMAATQGLNLLEPRCGEALLYLLICV